MEFTMNGRLPQAKGNRDDVMAPHGCYRCRGEDKWVAIAVGNDEQWKDFCLIMGKPELAADKRFENESNRLQNQDDLDKIISEWTREQTPVGVMTELQKVNIAAAPVYNAEEVYGDPHLRAREAFVAFDQPETGKRELPGVFAKLSRTPGVVRGREPLLGEHTDWLLNELLASDDS